MSDYTDLCARLEAKDCCESPNCNCDEAAAAFTAPTPAPAMELVEALRDIARQKLTDEMTGPEYKDADIDAGYDGCIERARAALTEGDTNG